MSFLVLDEASLHYRHPGVDLAEVGRALLAPLLSPVPDVPVSLDGLSLEVRCWLVRWHEAGVEDAVVVVNAAQVLGRLVVKLFRVVVLREVLQQVALVPVELVHGVSELSDPLEVLQLRGAVLPEGRLKDV